MLSEPSRINNKAKMHNFLLYTDQEVMMFSLLREQSFKTLMKFYLKEILESDRQRKKIQEANLETLQPRVKGDDEHKVLEMIRSLQDVHDDIQPYRNDLQSMERIHGDEAFQDILINVTKSLIDDPIRDSMVCNNQREEIQNEERLDYKIDNPQLIDWSLRTKLSRLSVIKSFLHQAGIDFERYLKDVEEKLVFFQAVKNGHDELCVHSDNYQSLVIFNQTIQEIVKNVHKISKTEIKQKGTTSSLIFYSHPIKGAEIFIYSLVKQIYEHKYTESLEENTVFYLSSLIMNSLKAVQGHRKDQEGFIGHSLLWTMDIQNFIDPAKRMLELIPDQIRLKESAELNERFYELSRVLLRELEHGKDLDSEDDYSRVYEFSRNKLIVMIEEFSNLYAIDLAVEFNDIENTTRIALDLKDYTKIYELINVQKFDCYSPMVQKSMQWLVDDYKERLRKRNKNEKVVYKLQIMDIYEEMPAELEKFFEKYPKLRLLYNMRIGEFEAVANQCNHLASESENAPKSILEGIAAVNHVGYSEVS
jgi:hypothetical protein